MAGVNPDGVGESGSGSVAKSRRFSTNRYPGFVGGEKDKETGNVVAPTAQQAEGTNIAPIEEVKSAPPEEQKGFKGTSNSTQILKAAILGRVICTELHRRKEMSHELYLADVRFTYCQLSPITVRGYQVWAVPCVRLMRRNRFARAIIKAIAMSRAEEIAYQVGMARKPNYAGKLVRLVGESMSYVVGLMVKEQDVSGLYQEKTNV